MNIRKIYSIITRNHLIPAVLTVFTCCLLFLSTTQVQAADLSALPRSITVVTENQKTSYKVKSIPAITYNGTSISSSFPSMQLDQVWMAAGEQFFRDQLGFAYSYDEELKQITMKNPELNVSMQFTVGSAQAQFNGASITLDYPVVKAKDVETGTIAYLLPLQSVLKQSGMAIQVSGSQISITHDLLFHKAVFLYIPLDNNKYSNALDGIYIKKTKVDGERILYMDTLSSISEKQIDFQESGSNLAVQITFPKTKNLLGNLSQNFSSGAIKKLEIREDGAYNTVVTIQYSMKYMYTRKFAGTSLTTTFSVANYDLRIALPEKVSFSKVTATDQYWNNRFLIIIPGNHVTFYKSNAPAKNNSVVKSVKVAKTAEGNTRITVTTKKLQGYRLIKGTDSYFTVDIGAPQSIYKNIVMLDAGHGGKDKGASKNGLKEKTLNYTILYTKAKQYFEAQDSTVKAYWTRHTDKFINLYQRPKYSEKYHADLFVSLHMNSGRSSAANGTEIYYSSGNNKKNSAGLNSRIFAKKMLSTITTDLGTKRRGVKQAGFVVIKHNTVPSVLIELGFVTGRKDSKKLRQSAYQTKAAKSIYRGISNVFRLYPTKR